MKPFKKIIINKELTERGICCSRVAVIAMLSITERKILQATDGRNKDVKEMLKYMLM
jgi:hypothetical protein